MLINYKDKHYWFITSNKSGSTFLSSVIQTISKNNELFKIVYQDREWTRELFLDEVIGVLDDTGREKLIEVLLAEDLNTYIVSHGWTHPLLEKTEVIKEENISRLE